MYIAEMLIFHCQLRLPDPQGTLASGNTRTNKLDHFLMAIWITNKVNTWGNDGDISVECQTN